MLATPLDINNRVSLLTTNENFSSNGKTLRKQGLYVKFIVYFKSIMEVANDRKNSRH